MLVRDLVWMLWTSFSGPGDDGDWVVTVNVERARLFRDVRAGPDVIEVMGQIQTQDAPASWVPVDSELSGIGLAAAKDAKQGAQHDAGNSNLDVGTSPPRPNFGRFWRGLSRALQTTIATAVAVATIAGAWFAYVAVRDARSHSAAQAAAARSAQARLISASLVPGQGGLPISPGPHGKAVTKIMLFNRSTAPIYHVIVSLVMVQGSCPCDGRQLSQLHGVVDPYQRDLLELPPGQYEVEVSGDWGGMMARPGVELAFTDDTDRNWLRYAGGELIGIPRPAAVYYGLEAPLNWIAPRAAG